ncbi:MAG: SDR family NAD(P)-dependent oxidoreductase, partial [Sediminibacterium sp.]
NVGIGPDLDFELPQEISFKKTFAVNVTGTTFFTEKMLQFLKVGGKIINMSSKMGSLDVCEKSDSVAYRMSKAALNMYTKILSNRLEGKQLVASVHPGWVRTNIAKSNIDGRLSPEESAQKIFQFITIDFKTGTFWNVETEAECRW